MNQQTIVFAVLCGALALFIAGPWRYDAVALLALLVLGLSGLVPAEQLFSGFGHPAVVTVAAVLVVSRGLSQSGAVDMLARKLFPENRSFAAQMLALNGITSISSAFMNNIGALALFMPVAVRVARQSGNSPSLYLMPLAFSSLLGGLITLIGTPPNIIISAFRQQATSAPYRMFDFTPVGLGVAAGGLLFVSLAGWRLLPRRKLLPAQDGFFNVSDYVTEVHVPAKSAAEGKSLRELETAAGGEMAVLGIIRNDKYKLFPSPFERLHAGDSLVIQASTENLQELIDQTGLALPGEQEKELEKNIFSSEEANLLEAVVLPGSPLEGKSAKSLNLRWRYGVNLLAVARQGTRLRARLSDIRLRAGDVLLLQGSPSTIQEAVAQLSCLPLAERGLRLGQPRHVSRAFFIFCPALLLAGTGILPVQVAFTAAALAMVLTGILSLRDAYESIDWPVIILLGAMIPVATALETTGGAGNIASRLVTLLGDAPLWLTASVIMLGTMLLSNVVNNAAAALLMAPVALTAAGALYISVDPLLMSVAVGASAAFLTPVGHQSNALVMGPGGYRFGDYWRMGLPLQIIVVALSVPLILRFWPPY